MTKRGFSVTALILGAIPFALGLLSFAVLALASAVSSASDGFGWFGVAALFFTGALAAVLVPISVILAVIALLRGDTRDRLLATIALALDLVLVVAAVVLTLNLS